MRSDKRKAEKIKNLVIPAALLSFCLFSMAAFGDISPKEVIRGEDGWLFYDSDRSMSDYKGTDLFPEYQLTNIRSRLEKTREYFDGQGIEFIIFLPPNKEHVYSEYMPASYGTPADYTRIDQLLDELGDEFNIVSPYSGLLMAKTLWPQYYFYYKTDAHWNELGAYIGAQTLLSAAGRSLPAFTSLKISPYLTPGRELAQPLGIEDTAWDIDYAVEGYGPYKNTEMIDESTDGNHLVYYTFGAPDENMVILGDSFSMGMAPYLGQFYQNIYIHRYNYFRSDIEEEHPSVVVYELIERSLDYLPIFEIIDE